MAISLSSQTLKSLPAQVGTPNWTRSDLTAGIVHFGVGNFHRAHMAGYLDGLMAQGRARDWGILGAGVTSYDAEMRNRLAQQDYLYTVVERDEAGTSARVFGSMIGFLDPTDRPGMIARMADPAIRIVSMTVTEGGYFLDATGHFDPTHPAIQREASQPQDPATVFGLIVAALRARREAGIKPFTVLSCDNVPHNGDVTRGVVVQLARLIDTDLAAWIDAEVAFPNSMVDRIAPAVGERERAFVAETVGIADAAPVLCEPFRQWVIEDKFSDGRPPLEAVGVTFVEDVTPYELMKIRMLNGGHATIAYPAGLLDITYVHDAMAHPSVLGFLKTLEQREIIPQVQAAPGMDPASYLELVSRRFANPTVGDTIRRLCFDGSNRQPKFIIATLRAALAAGGAIDGLALESALWCRYCRGTTESGAVIEPNDPQWDRLTAVAKAAASNPQAWLDMADIYGDAGQDPRFAAAFAAALKSIDAKGVVATIADYCARG